MRGKPVLGLVCAATLVSTCGGARAANFVARTAGAATAIAVDLDSVRRNGFFRAGWTYEMFRERNPLNGQRTQITGVLTVVNCKTQFARRLRVAHYLASGRVLSVAGPEPAWTDSLRGSNTDLMLRAICHAPDSAWARRRAASVFDLYAMVWKG